MPKFLFLIFLLCGWPVASGLVLADFQNERLEFDLFFKGLNAVHSNMWLDKNDSITTFNWTLKTKPVAKFLFSVDNSYQVTIDSFGTLLQAKKSIDQKNIQQEWIIDYDWPARRAISNQNYSWPVLDGCLNILPMLYDLRTKQLTPGDTLNYTLDIESQIWSIEGIVDPVFEHGNFTAHDIVFYFSPSLDSVERAWKTDIVTNRMGSNSSTLTIRLGPPPTQKPLLVRFGSDNAQIEMRLKH